LLSAIIIFPDNRSGFLLLHSEVLCAYRTKNNKNHSLRHRAAWYVCQNVWRFEKSRNWTTERNFECPVWQQLSN